MLDELLNDCPQVGVITWIGVAPARRAAIEALSTATLVPGTGIDGDHHAGSGRSPREVTLIQDEHLLAVSRILHGPEAEPLDPALVRRNLVVRGINLQALKDRRFQIGESVILQGSGNCPPCSRMREQLGPGGYQAMRGHGGITAQVLSGGEISLNDPVRLLPSD